jgi:exosortase
MQLRMRSRHGWRWWHLAGAVAMVAAAVFAAWGAWSDLLNIAMKDEEASHIFLVPIAVSWIVWVRREALRSCRPVGQSKGPMILAVGWVLWSFGYRYDVQSFWHGGAVIMAVGAALSVVGAEIMWRLLPAFAVLVFLVPVPGMLRQAIAQPLQTVTARATQTAGELIGMEVDRWGNALVVNGHEVTVAEACNGMRMVFSLFLVSYTLAFVTPLRPYVRGIILVMSPITAVLCNVIRLVPTVWCYGELAPAAADRFHDISGWAMLAVGFMMLSGIVRLLRWAMLPVSPYTLATSA